MKKLGLAGDEPYVLFDLRFGHAHPNYRLHANVTPSGEASGSLHLPAGILHLVRDRTGRDIRDVGDIGDARDLRQAPREALADPKAVGEALYRAVFTGRVGRLFHESVARLAPGQTLRLRLHLDDVSELSRIPWEYLRDPDWGLFLAQTSRISIVRYLGILDPGRPLPGAPPLKVVVVSAQPKDLPALAAGEEWEHLRAALGGKASSRRVHLEVLPSSTFEALAERLHRGPCHVLHFLGHGSFDVPSKTGKLFFEDDRGRSAPIDADRLSTLLFESDVRLVVLNTCRGAEASVDDAFSGVAQALVRQGIPAVVAMQFEITDRAAVRFAKKFYRPIAEGASIDFSLAQARRELYFHGDDAEWGTPVLYTCAPDGHLFEVAPRQGVERWREVVARPAVLAAAAVLLVGAIAVGLLSRPVRVPAGLPSPQAIPWAPASPECPSPSGTEIRFVRIPTGKFVMGSDRKGETPAHEVEITRPFCIGQFEVTEGQWRKGMQSDLSDPPKKNDDALPKTSVSWVDTQLFLDRLNRRAGSRMYRLASEAEWEYAARAGMTTAYSFGDNPFELFRYGNCLSAADHPDGFDGPAPVGQFLPNDWKLYDMHGNVWEWVGDYYAEYSAARAVNPVGPVEGVRRVKRGGWAKSSRDNCRSAVRNSSLPGKRMKDTGFRIVRELP
jgi:formylglycine-generating enzyme required for sulfatase activity